MWGIALKGVIAHRLRYGLTALAVLLGVAFIAGTFVLADGRVVDDMPDPTADSVLERMKRLDAAGRAV